MNLEVSLDKSPLNFQGLFQEYCLNFTGLRGIPGIYIILEDAR